MNRQNGIYILISFFFFQTLLAQEKKDSLAVQFHLRFDKAALVANQNYVSKNDTLQIEAFRFYISNIEIQYADHTAFKPKNNYHLIDLEIPESQRIPIDRYAKKQIQQITFAIGVDSLASVSGALAGELDPAKGMYWAWQSGYINMKIEGKSNSCKTRKNEFHFHIGGYKKPNYAMRTVVLPIQTTEPEINVSADLSKLFSEIALSKTNSIMIPGKPAMQIADYCSRIFQVE